MEMAGAESTRVKYVSVQTKATSARGRRAAFLSCQRNSPIVFLSHFSVTRLETAISTAVEDSIIHPFIPRRKDRAESRIGRDKAFYSIYAIQPNGFRPHSHRTNPTHRFSVSAR